MPEQQGPRRTRLEDGFANFTAIPNEVLRSTSLSGNAKALYAVIVDVCVFKRDEPTQEELGALLGGGEKTARTALLELRDAGLLEIRRPGQGKPNEYTLMLPKGRSEPAAEAVPSISLRQRQDKVKDLRATTQRRSPDVLWDALVELFGGSPTGRTERGAWNAALRSLRESGATPATLRAAATAWPHTFERATMTPFALAKHWTLLTGTPKSAEKLRKEQIARELAEWRAEQERLYGPRVPS